VSRKDAKPPRHVDREHKCRHTKRGANNRRGDNENDRNTSAVLRLYVTTVDDETVLVGGTSVDVCAK
jgi:hypothetical protein